MGFSLVILTKEWLQENYKDRKISLLYHIINKGYDKSRVKYNIIATQRIKQPDLILHDLGFHPNKNFFFVLLLASNDDSQRTANKITEFERDFSIQTNSLGDAFNCDLPHEIVEELGPLTHSSVNVRIADSDFELNEDVSKRLIGTAGFKDYQSEDEDRRRIHLELTSFISFMRRSGAAMLDSIIKLVLCDELLSEKLLHRGQIEGITLHGGVVKEHKLVDYYTNHCGFQKSSRKDHLVKVSSEGELDHNILEEGILALQSFHISFIYRTIEFTK